MVAGVLTGSRGSGIIWLVCAETICSAGSSMAAAGSDDGGSSSSVERAWLDDGEDLFCCL